MPAFTNSIAFVVPTKDRPHDLRRMLKSVQDQSVHPDQIVIVDGSTNPVADVASEFPDLKIEYVRCYPPSLSNCPLQGGRMTFAFFSDWILNALAESRELTMFNDVFFTPILINDLVDKMIDLMVRKATGIFHVAGGERLSKYAFAIELTQVFNYSKDNIRQISVERFPFRAKRPKDMSLSSEKAGRYLGMRMPAVKDSLNRLKEKEGEGHPAALERAVREGYLI